MTYQFNRICIIESLRDNDMKTGQLLYDNIQYIDVNKELFDIEIELIKNADGLAKYFEIIAHDIIHDGVLPLLQIEAHGDEIGIQLQSGETIIWSEMIDYFRNLNILTCNNLLVVLVLCKGGYIISALGHYITLRAPFAALFHSFEKITNDEIHKGFPEFYRSIVNDEDISDALNKLNRFIGDDKRHFERFSCALLLKDVFRYYLNECSRSKVINKLVNKSLDYKRKQNKGKDFDINYFRKIFRQRALPVKQEWFFNLVKSKFLMYDLDSTNAKRFPVSFQEVIKT